MSIFKAGKFTIMPYRLFNALSLFDAKTYFILLKKKVSSWPVLIFKDTILFRSLIFDFRVEKYEKGYDHK